MEYYTRCTVVAFTKDNSFLPYGFIFNVAFLMAYSLPNCKYYIRVNTNAIKN
jgi:hypothetical protein